MSGTWNRLFTFAKSDYVILLHDDMLYSDALITISDLLHKSKEKYAAYCTRYLIYDMKNKAEIPIRGNKEPILKEIKTFDFMWGNIAGPPSGVCFNRKSIIDMGGFSIIFRLSLLCKTLVLLQNMYYRRSSIIYI